MGEIGLNGSCSRVDDSLDQSGDEGVLDAWADDDALMSDFGLIHLEIP